MATPANQVVAGFSLTNRWLLYTSFMLSPAQFISGIGSNLPTNIGFLAYNWYTQIQWYRAVRDKELHALSLLPVHFNLIYAVTYIGGVTSGNLFMAIILGAGSAGVLILNTVSAWVSWSTNQPEGFDEYQFFFFGWRILTGGWHKFILVWQIGDSIFTCASVLIAIYAAIQSVFMDDDESASTFIPWRGKSTNDISKYKYPVILVGAVVMMVGGWPLILWTELIVQRNHIESDTDMVAVWLFVVQVVAMILPSVDSVWAFIWCTWRRKK
ncbi:hypothetical protein H634G_10590 [Metarhizium anisopliae BRIP 53293]|uniref:Uncharacterized protein n=1 Tax=Metarhizium anisopliae BRIP 53293 TaxID=1291518 RepID=A0A0D9NJI0_METAN|nr:hypothetical protein H634G_10590 [Metarhizium anisopliae BRIP 53293]KJK84996.1 hypothetical protein H633G_11174 [Metarhizium anisopliae BRIP 53284]